MIVKPSTQSPRPIALVTPGYHALVIETTDGTKCVQGPNRVFEALKSLKGHVVYAKGLMSLLAATDARQWQASCWKGRATAMQLDGTTTKIMSLRDALGEGDFQDLCVVSSWLADHQVRMGSLSSIAWHLWQSTLPAPISMASLPALGAAAFYGPRQEVRRPRSSQHMSIVDVTNAYPAAMVARPIALTLREVSNATFIDPSRGGLARARVTVPHELAFAPLPVRVAQGVIQWRTGDVRGVWPWCELAAAQEMGCQVGIERCYAPMIEASPFDQWFALQAEARSLGGWAGNFMKHVGTLLWGMFAMSGDFAATVRWSDEIGEHPIVVDRPTRRLPQASTAHVAAEIAARVRTDTLAEVYKMKAFPIHIDTDGVIVRRSVATTYPKTAIAGQWRRKTAMRRVEVRAPQLYRYQCDQDCCIADMGPGGNWHYVAAGMTNHQAAELFDRVATPSRISVMDRDCVLPPMRHDEKEKLEPYLKEAQMLRMALFGPSLDR